MNKYRNIHLVFFLFLITTMLLVLTSCQALHRVPDCTDSSITAESTESNLRQFAYANCLFWYLKKMGYDTKDIRAISGGIVELGYSSADKYQKISIFVKNYKPDVKTKNEIDVDLLKCFMLDQSEELNQLIESLK